MTTQQWPDPVLPTEDEKRMRKALETIQMMVGCSLGLPAGSMSVALTRIIKEAQEATGDAVCKSCGSPLVWAHYGGCYAVRWLS
jgi:hypothetical protein